MSTNLPITLETTVTTPFALHRTRGMTRRTTTRRGLHAKADETASVRCNHGEGTGGKLLAGRGWGVWGSLFCENSQDSFNSNSLLSAENSREVALQLQTIYGQ